MAAASRPMSRLVTVASTTVGLSCHDHALSGWRKLSLGPGRGGRCARCGAPIRVSWRSGGLLFLATIFAANVGGLGAWMLFLVAIGTMSASAEIAVYLAGAIAATVPFGWAYVRYVPLSVRDA